MLDRTIEQDRLKHCLRMLLIALTGVGSFPLAALAQTQTPADQTEKPVIKPPPVPTGVIPLPQGPPPTGQQAPVPAPVRPLPKPDHPLLSSPDLAAISAALKNHPLTMDEAVTIALYTNRSFATATAALQRAQGRTGQARSALNPTVGVNATVPEYDAPTKANFGGNSILVLPQFNPSISTAATLPLDLSGSLRAAVNQAQFQEVAARVDVNRVRNQIVYDVKTAFYNALRAQAQIAVATDTLNNALNRLDDANKNYTAGTSPRFDVISAQRDVADAQRGLIDARSQLSLNLAALKNTMGLDITTRLRITEQGAVEAPPGVAPPTVPPIGPDGRPVGPAQGGPAQEGTTATPSPAQPPTQRTLELPRDASGKLIPLTAPTAEDVEEPLDFGPEYTSVLQEALQTRPEIFEADAQIAAAKKGIQYARRSQLPTVSVSVGYVYTPNAPAGFARTQQAEATLGLSVPIFDGGLARERLREARADVASAETNRRQTEDGVKLEVQQAYIALVQARNRVAVANVGLAQARESYRLARVRYNAGVSQQQGISPQLEISTAQTSLAQAQTNQVNALYDYNNARAQLDRAVGRYSYVAHGPGYNAPPRTLDKAK